MKDFNIIEQLKGDGFKACREHVNDGGFKYVVYTKEYRKETNVVWYGKSTIVFVADVTACYNKSGELVDITAQFSNGKVKSYKPGKQAYNAIRDTIKYNGFEI